MRIDEDAVRAVARLARIRVAEGELTGLAAELTGVLKHLETLSRLSPAVAEGVLHPTPEGARSDAPSAGLDHDDLAALVPMWRAPFIAAPASPAIAPADRT
jgi:aspartyl/glutamyl-tRNA(Asn/Gln) amidotransferase C subunit